MSNVYLPMTEELYQRFEHIRDQLNSGTREKMAKPLGEVLADLSCQMIDRLFGDLIAKSKQKATSDRELSMIADSEKVVSQVMDTFKKYMPYAVSLFGNERLQPVVDYLHEQMLVQDEQRYLTFKVDDALLQRTITQGDQVKAGQQGMIVSAFDGLIEIIDAGVTALIRKPKQILKFNFVVDKTLTGVVNMTTHLGYKRLEKLATQMDTRMASQYVDHFIGFSQFQNKK